MPPRWVWPGYLARGHSTLLTGLWKAGKTTLVAHLLADLGRGGGLVVDPVDGPALIISEESASLWSTRRDSLALGNWINVAARPFKLRPTIGEWEDCIGEAAGWVGEHGASLVIVDTLPAQWCCDDENDAAKVLSALTPLHGITEAGAALLLCHHPKKGDAGQGQAGRGSGALPGWVDIILELRRHSPEDAGDRRRTLRAYSRFDETPAEVVLELRPEGYTLIGDRATVAGADRSETILGLLPAARPGLTADAIREDWPSGEKPGLTRLRGDLNFGVNQGRWAREGSGRKGDPFTYLRASRFHSVTPNPRRNRDGIESNGG